MYLTQIMLANTVGINYIIADCQRMHTLVMSGFPSGDSETPRSDMAVLYDVEPTRSGVRVLIQSDIAPNIDAYRMYCARNTEPCVKNISALSEVLQNGMKLRFSVCANPTVQQSHTHGPRSARRFISDRDSRLPRISAPKPASPMRSTIALVILRRCAIWHEEGFSVEIPRAISSPARWRSPRCLLPFPVSSLRQ